MTNPTKSVNPYPIVIIGGGIAGLNTAISTRQLLPNHKIILAESSNTLGGRVKSVEFQNHVYDLGASWFHDARNNILFDIVKQQQWNVVKDNNHEVEVLVLQNNKLVEIKSPREKLEKINLVFQNIGDDASEFDMSLKSYAEKFDPNNSLVYRCYEHFVGQPWFEISAVECPQNVLDHGDDYFQFDGNQKLIELLHQKCTDLDIEFRMEEELLSLEDCGTYIEVVTHANGNGNGNGNDTDRSQNKYLASHVIVTVSLGVLHTNYKQMFKSPLPESLEYAIENGEMSHLTKLVVSFPFKFWRPLAKMIIIDVNGNSYFLKELNNSTVLMIAPPPLSFELEKTEDKFALVSDIFSLLNISGQKVPNPINVFCSDWSTNKKFLGSYSTLKVGQNMRDFVLPFKTPHWEDKLIFAGEHTSINGIGCMDGAYDSGIRAANQISESIRDKEQ